MRRTSENESKIVLTVNKQQLAAMLNCGLDTATRIGEKSGAKIKVGKRVLYLVSRVNSYLEDLADSNKCTNLF